MTKSVSPSMAAPNENATSGRTVTRWRISTIRGGRAPLAVGGHGKPSAARKRWITAEANAVPSGRCGSPHSTDTVGQAVASASIRVWARSRQCSMVSAHKDASRSPSGLSCVRIE